jgi:hypothetical protein
MSITARDRTWGDADVMGRLPMLASPLGALLYPFALEGFNTSVTRIAAGAYTLSWLSAAACLALAFAMPLIAMLAAMPFSEIGNPTVAQLRAKRTALLAVAAPTLFTFVGVVLTMLHDPVPDTWLWVACWAIALALLLRSDNGVPAVVAPRPIPAPKVFRHVYRNDVLQPLVVALFLFQVGTGLFFVWRLTAAPSDRFRTFQIASGVYLAFYVLGHMDSVFIFARTYLDIDTGWDFATGAPTGLVKDRWNIRLVPHYWLGAFFVLAHLAAGARGVMMAHGVSKACQITRSPRRRGRAASAARRGQEPWRS